MVVIGLRWCSERKGKFRKRKKYILLASAMYYLLFSRSSRPMKTPPVFSTQQNLMKRDIGRNITNLRLFLH